MTKKYLFLVFILFYLQFVFAQKQLTVNQPLPSRQVHLDFHTSEYIPAIGEK